jgi:hypothetical protein
MQLVRRQKIMAEKYMTSTTETTVLGLFEEIDQAATALRHLKSERGANSQDLMVLSSVPFPEGVLEADRSPIRLPLITVIFAVVGILFGIALAAGTAQLYLIRVGGKPVSPVPPTAIIAYEMMMLFALSAAFFAALFEMRLPSWRSKVYDPRISEGMIGIAAHCADAEQAARAESFCREAGAADVRRDARSFE